jgi:hypothetical protein
MVVVAVRVGNEKVAIGLTPRLPISVAPSGTVPPETDETAAASGENSGDAVPVEDTIVEDPELQPLDDIPPSKVEPLDIVVGCVVGELPTPRGELAVDEQVRGLKPPPLISVAPSGMPVGAPEVGEPSPLSGDVAPSAGIVAALCA